MFDTERFIFEVEKRPVVYDPEHRDYNDRQAKAAAWDEICEVMVRNWAKLTEENKNLEVKILRGKWRNIRDYFIKELRYRKSQESNPDGKKRKKYMYFDDLMFLLPTIENKRFKSTRRKNRIEVKIKPCKYEESESESEMDYQFIEESDDPLNTASSMSVSKANGEELYVGYTKKMNECSYDSFNKEYQDALPSTNRRMILAEDYDQMFLLSLLPIIRRVPEEKKLDVRIQIQHILALALQSPNNV